MVTETEDWARYYDCADFSYEWNNGQFESLSDSSQAEVDRNTTTKKAEYAGVGVREYFMLDERGNETAFYRLSARGVYAPIHPVNDIIQSQVLPGFQFHTADLYRLPDVPALVTDPIYNTFAAPFVRQERTRTEEAEARRRTLCSHPEGIRN